MKTWGGGGGGGGLGGSVGGVGVDVNEELKFEKIQQTKKHSGGGGCQVG